MTSCPVCYTGFTSAYFVCGHGLCKHCAIRWLRYEDTCPMCRTCVGSDFVDMNHVPRLNRARRALSCLEGKQYECNYDRNVLITGTGGIVTWVKKKSCI